MLKTASVDVGTGKLTFETGRVAKQAHGSVICRSGDTMVLSAVTVAPEIREGQDFFPMTVDYREKFYAVGQIPGNFFRRESRPSEREILVCRMTDRPLRPLFPKKFLNELMVCQTVMSADNINNPDVLSINAASAALHISKIPLQEPVGAVRVGCIDGELIANPIMEDMPKSTLDIIVAGTRDSICMVEGQANEVSELVMMDALEFAHGHIRNIIGAIDELREMAGVEKMDVPEDEPCAELVAEIEGLATQKLAEALAIKEKQLRLDSIDNVKAEVEEALLAKNGEEWMEESGAEASEIFNDLKKRIMRESVIETNIRMDGRQLDEIRKITVDLDILPRAHGSVLFTRGETQAIVTTTLGTGRDEMRIDELTGDEFRRFFLHYNFPAWSVGEVRRITGPGRREVGHGKLAERALEPVLPFLQEKDEEAPQENEIRFPYTVRIVADITESNGSSSMASVCGGSLSMMAAGVPVTSPVAGIAMGMIKEGDEVRILSDILGDEDHLGDMDFKVCGTANGITAFQMDTKVKGLSREVMEQALEQARAGRAHILGIMEEAIADPRKELSPYAPRIFTINIHPDKIREVIGPGGKVIRQIQAETGAEIEIEDDGTVNIAATNQEDADAAKEFIREIVAEVEVGKIYRGRVTRIMNFGAFCSVIGSKEGLVHISELADYRVHNVTDIVDVGDEIDIKVIEIDQMGRVNLSKIAADRELDQVQPAPEGYFDQQPRGGGGGGGHHRDRDNRGGRGGRGGDRRDGGRRSGPPRGRRDDRSNRD